MKTHLAKTKKSEKNTKNISKKKKKRKEIKGYYFDGQKLETLYEEKR